MTHRPFGWPRHALLATALALIWFHPPLLSGSPPAFIGQAFQLVPPALPAPSEAEGSRAEGSAAEGPVRHQLLRAAILPAPVVGALLARPELRRRAAPVAPQRSHSDTLPLFHSATLSQAPAQTGAITEIRALFAEYIRLHAAKEMDEWRDKLFLPEAICVQTLSDGKVRVFQIAELAQLIAEEAKSLDEQREAFEDVRIEVYGNAAHYAATWRLFHNGKEAGKGRAFFSLVKKEGAWKIASLVWYRE